MITVKRGDTQTIYWKTNMDLTGASVRLLAKNIRTKVLTELPVTISDAPLGTVAQAQTGTMPVGKYRIELEITRGAVIVSAPTKGYEELCIIPDLG